MDAAGIAPFDDVAKRRRAAPLAGDYRDTAHLAIAEVARWLGARPPWATLGAGRLVPDCAVELVASFDHEEMTDVRGAGGEERAARAALSGRGRRAYGLGSVNSEVCGFRYGSFRAPASHLPDRFQIRSPRVMSDS